MSIISDFFALFNFKESFGKVFSKENIAVLKGLIREKIIVLVKENIPGQEKMDKVIDAAIDFINKHMHSDNKIVQWIIDTFIIENIRPIAQSIYDDLKEVVKGL